MSDHQPVWKRHPRILHYTDQEGCLGILKSGRLWASHFGTVNDLTEFRTITPLLQKELYVAAKQLWKSGAINLATNDESAVDKMIREGADAIPNIMWKVTFDKFAFGQAYLVSFCGTHEDQFVRENGLLSQWRGYGSGGGYAIEFDTLALHEMAEQYGQHFEMFGHIDEVVYGTHSPNYANYADKLQEFLKLVPVYGFLTWLASAPSEAGIRALKLFIQLATLLKDRAFSEEHEVRFVTMRIIEGADKPLIPLRFRTRDGRLVPYIELFDPHDIRKAVRGIIVGPHADSKEREKYLQFYLTNHEIRAAVTVSKIPFRPS